MAPERPNLHGKSAMEPAEPAMSHRQTAKELMEALQEVSGITKINNRPVIAISGRSLPNHILGLMNSLPPYMLNAIAHGASERGGIPVSLHLLTTIPDGPLVKYMKISSHEAREFLSGDIVVHDHQHILRRSPGVLPDITRPVIMDSGEGIALLDEAKKCQCLMLAKAVREIGGIDHMSHLGNEHIRLLLDGKASYSEFTLACIPWVNPSLIDDLTYVMEQDPYVRKTSPFNHLILTRCRQFLGAAFGDRKIDGFTTWSVAREMFNGKKPINDKIFTESCLQEPLSVLLSPQQAHRDLAMSCLASSICASPSDADHWESLLSFMT